MLLVVCADSDNSRVEPVKFVLVLRELAQLPHAKGSPVTTVENKDHAGAASGGEMERLSVLILKSEIGRRLAVNKSKLRFGNPHQDDRKQADNEDR
jgi:hypothetical protein